MVALGFWGLYVAQSDRTILLTNVDYEVEVKGFASNVTIRQTYRNAEKADLECVYVFPMNDQAAVTGFTIRIGDRTLTSQFKKKDEAFKGHSDALSQGHGAYLLDQSDRSDDTFVLSVGRLPPGQECTVSISYVSILDALTETKQRLVIPTALSPRYDPNPSSEKGIGPPEVYQPSVSYTATLKGTIETIGKVRTVSSSSHPISVTIGLPNKVAIAFGPASQPLDRDIIIDIELESNPQHSVFVEKYVAMYSFVPHYGNTKEDRLPKGETWTTYRNRQAQEPDRVNACAYDGIRDLILCSETASRDAEKPALDAKDGRVSAGPRRKNSLGEKIKAIFGSKSGSSSKNHDYHGAHPRHESEPANKISETQKPDEMPLLNKIVVLQQWDGSWKLSSELAKHLGVKRASVWKAVQIEANENMVTTLLVVAFLRKRYPKRSSIWGPIVIKAKAFVEKVVPEDKQEEMIGHLGKAFLGP